MKSVIHYNIVIMSFGFLFLNGCKDPEKTGIEILPNMVHSVPYDAYSENELAPDGTTNMLPPKGSIARGFLPHHFVKDYDDAENASNIINPYGHSEKTLARGKYLYGNYCMVCHGERGDGDGPLIPKFPTPPSFKSKMLLRYTEGTLFHIITMGSGQMPSHSAQILAKDRWHIAEYVKSLQQ